MSDVTVSAVPFIRQHAFRIADRLKTNEGMIEDVITSLKSIEDGKHSPLTFLWDAEHILSEDEIDALPKVGSKAPEHLKEYNQLYDWYETSDGKSARYFFDMADRFLPDIPRCKDLLKRYKKDPNDKDANLPEGFEYPEHGTEELDRLIAKYNRRHNNLRAIFARGFHVRQIVNRINDLPDVGCEIEKSADGAGYDRSPNPISIWSKTGKRKFAVWSVGSLLLLDRPLPDEKGEDSGLTVLDSAIAKGGTYDQIIGAIKRDSSKKNERANAFAGLKANNPEEVMTCVNTMVGYFYDVKDGDWVPKPNSETKLYQMLGAKDQQEARHTVAKLQEALDALVAKLDPILSRDVQDRHNGTTKAA